MPPKRRHSQKSPLPEEESPDMAKQVRGGAAHCASKQADRELAPNNAPQSVTPDLLLIGQKSSQQLPSSQKPPGSQQFSGSGSTKFSTGE